MVGLLYHLYNQVRPPPVHAQADAVGTDRGTSRAHAAAELTLALLCTHPGAPPPPRPNTHTHTLAQFAFNTLQRVSPVSHGVCNVVKRVVIIFSSVIFFNQTLTQQALVGTVIALIGTWLYTEASSRAKKKPAGGAGGAGKPATA
jgi:hypothetical protein